MDQSKWEKEHNNIKLTEKWDIIYKGWNKMKYDGESWTRTYKSQKREIRITKTCIILLKKDKLKKREKKTNIFLLVNLTGLKPWTHMFKLKIKEPQTNEYGCNI